MLERSVLEFEFKSMELCRGATPEPRGEATQWRLTPSIIHRIGRASVEQL